MFGTPWWVKNCYAVNKEAGGSLPYGALPPGYPDIRFPLNLIAR